MAAKEEKKTVSGNMTDMHKPTHLEGGRFSSHMHVSFIFLSRKVLTHSRERRVMVKRQLTDVHRF